MTTYSTSNMLGVNVAQTYSTSTDLYPWQNTEPPFALGQVATGTDGSAWVFVLAGENINQYDAVAIDEAFEANQLTSTEAALGQKFGVASQGDIASGDYGWVQVRGVTTVFTLGGTADGTRLVSSATAGALDDSTTVGTVIKGIVTTASNTLTTKAAVAAFMTVEPFCDIPAIAEVDIETRDGLLWPVGDKMAYPTILGELAEIPVILGYCKSRRTCIQAGGNAGLWPRVLATEFEMLYTFEPDRTLFHCLVNNVKAPNVVFMNAALGERHALVGLDRMYWPANAGAMQTTKEGRIPTLRIDDLAVTDCDLLQLDIEGAELHALKGATETIKASKPVIVLELRRNGRAFGVFDQQIREHVYSLGYKTAEKLNFDEVFIPA